MSWGLLHKETLIIVAILIALWIIGSIFIYKKAKSSFTIRRVFFLAIGLLGITLIVIEPSHQVNIDTEEVHIWTSEIIEFTESANNFNSVHDFLQSDLINKTSSVHIHGPGLTREEIELIDGYRIHFHETDIISGINRVNIPAITEREPWILSGNVQGEDIESISLNTPNNEVHAGTILDGSFTIPSTAPVAGSYLYDITTVLSSGDTISERLPIVVNHEPTWQMLVLASFPSFENNYLKNYWTSLGNGFAMRTKISKEKYSTTFVNSTKRSLENLTSRTISKYDFIITDAPTWNQLPTIEQSNIKSAIRNNGLALIIRPSENLTEANGLGLPKWTIPKEINWSTITGEIKLSNYPIASSWASAKAQGHILSKYQARGLGHVAMLGIDDTYKLILADYNKDYQKLWSSIFTKLYRDFSPKSKLLHDQWIWAGAKNTLSIMSQEDNTKPPLLNDSISLSYLNVPFLVGVTEINLWPSKGYNEISLGEDQTLAFYAHPKDTWLAVQQSQLQPLNRRAADRSESIVVESHNEDKPYSLYWWYSLALLGFGCLWLDERLFG